VKYLTAVGVFATAVLSEFNSTFIFGQNNIVKTIGDTTGYTAD
jgi:hypothetical protein